MHVKPNTIAIIGAGIIGTTIAERLQYEGKQVLLIDRLGVGEGCSKGNAGHFASDIIMPLANFRTLLQVPKLLLDPTSPLTIRWSYFPKLLPWLGRFALSAMPHRSRRSIEALKLLNRPAIKRYKHLLQRTRLNHLLTQQGALTVYRSDSAAAANRRHADFVRQHGVVVEQLSGHSIRELEPALDKSIVGGLYFPETAHSINPHELVVSLATKFQNRGGQLLRQAIDHIKVDSNGGVILYGDQPQIHVDQVIVACGAWSKKLAQSIGHHVPLESERGYHLMLPNPGLSLNRPVTSYERSFVMTPMQQGLRLAGTVELAGLKTAPDYRRADILLTHARELLPKLLTDQSDSSHWMGHRPSTPDSLPVIGRSPKVPQVIFAFGHQHLGLTQAAVTADWVANMLLERPIPLSLGAFRIDRF